jgi:NAD(P)H-quinone oxidoreductase subunit 4
MLLSSLLLIPFLGCLAVLAWPGSPTPGRLRQITIVILVAQLAMSLLAAVQFDLAQPGLQLTEHHSWIPGIGLDYALGIDGLSLPLVLINGALTLVSAVITRDISKRPRV